MIRYFLLSIILVLLYSCGDDGPNCPGNISLPVAIGPYKLSYTIGDTITVLSSFYKLIYDKKTDKYYDASSYKFTPFIQLFTIDSSVEYNSYSKINEIALYCTPAADRNFQESLGELVGEYRLLGDTLAFNVKLICLKKGNMFLRIGSLSTGDGHLQNNYHFGCRGREITFSLKSPAEDNIRFLQQHRSNDRNNWILTDSIGRFKQYAGYCFEVR